MDKRDILLVGLGGFAGAIARVLLSGAVTQASSASRFPIGTLVVNVLGCLVIGVLAGISEYVQPFAPSTKYFLFTGVLGGFTTFSAFGLETYVLVRDHAWGFAAGNIVLQLGLGLVAVWAGMAAVGAIAK